MGAVLLLKTNTGGHIRLSFHSFLVSVVRALLQQEQVKVEVVFTIYF